MIVEENILSLPLMLCPQTPWRAGIACPQRTRCSVDTWSHSVVLLWGVQTLGIAGPHWKKSCLGPHIKYTNTNETDEQKKILSKFTVLCWAAFIAILGRM